MKRKLVKRLLPALILLLLAAHTGCYSPAYYPSYDAGYGAAVPYQGGYPAPGFGQNYPDSYGQPGYYGQSDNGQGYWENDDDQRQDEQNQFWQRDPYENFYGQ